MILKRSSTLVLFVSLVGTWISGDDTLADAAPISQLLARQASSPSSPNPAPRPSPGRVQIKLVNTPPPPPSFRRSDKSSSSQPKNNNDILASVPEPPKDAKVLDSWYMIEQRRRGHSLSLHGHAVLDDEDDDAGNELLDTELDGLLRPDEDDTIEGEAIEEEEEDDEQEDEDDIDAEAARIRDMYSFNLNHRNRNRDASSLKALDEQEAEMLEEVQDQAEEEDEEEEDEEEEEDWLARRGFRDSELFPEDLEDDEEPETEMPLPTVTNPRFQVVVSRFGGNAAAADMAAGLD